MASVVAPGDYARGCGLQISISATHLKGLHYSIGLADGADARCDGCRRRCNSLLDSERSIALACDLCSYRCRGRRRVDQKIYLSVKNTDCTMEART